MFRSHIWVISCRPFLTLTHLTEHNVLKFHPCCCRWQDVLLSHGWIIFHCTYIPHHLYPFVVVDGNFGWFYVLAIVNNAAWENTYMSHQYSVFISFRYIPRSKIPQSCISFIFNFWGIFLLFSIVAEPIYISITPTVQEGFLLSGIQYSDSTILYLTMWSPH